LSSNPANKEDELPIGNGAQLHVVRPVETAAPQSEVAQAAAEFDEFIYVLSHDLRASIRTLVEVPQWIGEDLVAEGHAVSETMSENLSMMEVHAHRLDQMLVDLLAYSRIGRMQKIQDVSISRAMSSVITSLDVPAGFEVVQNIAHDQIQIGASDIVTLLSAILSNAIKHHDTETGRFSISTEREADELIFRMQDDGPGIPAKYRDRVFEVMTTLRPRDEVEGSGMGLALVKKIISFYGGRLDWVDNASGRGTGFVVYLPLVSARVIS